MTVLEASAPAAALLVDVPPEGLPLPPNSWEYSLQVPHKPAGPGVARATVVTILTQHNLRELADTAELLTSELATNAYRYSTDPVSVRVKWLAPRLRVSVWDSNPSLPVPLPSVGKESEGGRGLVLVRMCADDWGSFALGQGRPGLGGKVVWFELVRRRPAR